MDERGQVRLTAIDGVDGGEGGEKCQEAVTSIDPVKTQSNIVHDSHDIFAAID